MKKIFLLAILASALSGNAQSLKDALYSGKLKLDTGQVIRKGDDLSSKIDTTTRKPAPVETKVTAPPATVLTVQGDSVVVTTVAPIATPATDSTMGTTADNTAPKSNDRAWKDFVTELQGTLRTDVLPSKKIKAGTYSLLVDYTIDVDGQIIVNNVNSSPENSFLAEQVRERITLSAPKMTPLLGTNGKPRKAPKKYTMVVTK
ncbi:MAG: hypothetical protein ABI480_05345, partial [Chitinophagaceae bacterium]